MQSIESIRRQISRIKNYYIFFTEKEIRYLPQVMAMDERILALTSGYVGSDTWLAVCTNRQVIFANRGMIYGTEQYQMPLSRIQSVDYETGIFFGSIRVWDGAKSISIGYVWKSSIPPFIRAVQEAMHAEQNGRPIPGLSGNSTPQPASTSNAVEDTVTALERLAKLKAQGVLTDDEFEAQKKKILG